MPNWKKLIVSGSNASLNSLDVVSSIRISGSSALTGSLNITGSLLVTGSTAFTGSIFVSGTVSGSFQGDGSGLTDLTQLPYVGNNPTLTSDLTIPTNFYAKMFGPLIVNPGVTLEISAVNSALIIEDAI
jgi:hypothetical protein|tara:strand:- start:451 stop:837 length:387 start_codon:yes stop_codon:yes gene_type:complete